MELAEPLAIGLPLSLSLIMLSLGMTLTLADFYRLFQRPRAFAVGFAAQMLGLPLLAAVVVVLMDPPVPLALGLMAVAFCPSGTTSNLFAHHAHGDVALSIGLTGVASVVTPFSVPLLTGLCVAWLGGEARAIDFPVGVTMARLAAVVLLPLLLGMALRARMPRAAATARPWLHGAAVAGFAAVILGILVQMGGRLPGLLESSGSLCATLMLLAIGFGFGVGRLAGLDRAARRTIGIELGMQHGGMALLVTQGALGSPEASVVPIVYGLMMLLPVLLIVLVARPDSIPAPGGNLRRGP